MKSNTKISLLLLLALALPCCAVVPANQKAGADLAQHQIKLEFSASLAKRDDGSVVILWQLFNRSGYPVLIDRSIAPMCFFSTSLDPNDPVLKEYHAFGTSSTQKSPTDKLDYRVLPPTQDGTYVTTPDHAFVGTLVVADASPEGQKKIKNIKNGEMKVFCTIGVIQSNNDYLGRVAVDLEVIIKIGDTLPANSKAIFSPKDNTIHEL